MRGENASNNLPGLQDGNSAWMKILSVWDCSLAMNASSYKVSLLFGLLILGKKSRKSLSFCSRDSFCSSAFFDFPKILIISTSGSQSNRRL